MLKTIGETNLGKILTLEFTKINKMNKMNKMNKVKYTNNDFLILI